MDSGYAKIEVGSDRITAVERDHEPWEKVRVFGHLAEFSPRN